MWLIIFIFHTQKKNSLMLGIRIWHFNFCNFLFTSKVVLIIQLNRVFMLKDILNCTIYDF
jgi:hypothetical protein